MQSCDVIQDPERPSLGRRYQVIVVYAQISDRNPGKIKLQRLPLPTIIERHVHPRFGACIEQAPLLRILTDNTGKGFVADALHNRCPAATVIVGLVNHRCEVIEFVARDGDVCSRRIMRRYLDRVDLGFGHSSRRDVLPVATTILRDEHAAVVGPCPDRAGIMG